MRALLMFFLLFPILATPQNLIKNPGFENYTICPDAAAQFNGYVDDWKSYFSTPDYLNQCGFYPLFWTDSVPPRTGQGIATCKWLTYLADYEREYLHGEISEALVAGKTYYLEFYVYTVPSIGLEQIQAHFTKEVIDTIPANGILEITAHIENQHGIITQRDWVKISGCYLAQGGEEYVILGNFETNENTDTIHLINNPMIHFTLVDDVALYELSGLVPPNYSIIEGTLVPYVSSTDLDFYLNDSLIDLSDYIFEDSGSFVIEVYIEGCGYLGSFEVDVAACGEIPLSESLIQDTVVCIGEEMVLYESPDSSVEYYLDGMELESPHYLFSDSGHHHLVAFFPACSSYDSMTVVVKECHLADTASRSADCIYIPNAFSPNGDGINDELQVFSNCETISYNFKVYNRWGGLLFSSSSIDEPWRGENRDGRKVGLGVYVYLVTLEFNVNGVVTKIVRSGDVTVFR